MEEFQFPHNLRARNLVADSGSGTPAEDRHLLAGPLPLRPRWLKPGPIIDVAKATDLIAQARNKAVRK